MGAFIAMLKRLCGWMNTLAGIVLFLMMMLTVVDVIMRLFGTAILGTYELVAVSGIVKTLEEKGTSTSIRVCESEKGDAACVTATFSNAKINPALFGTGENVRVVGLVRAYMGAKLISASEVKGVSSG